MLSPSTLQIFLVADAENSGEVRPVLEQAGHHVAGCSFSGVNGESLAGCNLIVVDATGKAGDALPLCQQMRLRLGDTFVPILVITNDTSPGTRLAALESGADSYLLRPFAAAELLAQVQAFARIKDRHDKLMEKTAEVHRINKRLQAAYQQIDQELELAGRIQVSFLPQSLPELPQLRFAVYYRPYNRVGGDFYDVFRLDENHYGFYVADAMGHGIPASLLTIFVKKGIKTKEINGHSYRLIPPNEVMQQLNHDLIEQELSDRPFITMVYGLLNHHSGTLEFSRSGHPYPLYLPHDGPPDLWKLDGTLLGVFDTTYPNRKETLRPGDKLLLYTDGMDKAQFQELQPGMPSLLACVEHYRDLPVQDLVQKTAVELFGDEAWKDDLTLFGLEFVSKP
jgi:sigma-B regulation protein RsbU (phosphoserine phosphatase)